MITYRTLTANEIEIPLFSNFNRHQEVTKCWRKIDGEWVIKDIAFTEEWAEKEFAELTRCLKNTVNIGGYVAAAFSDDKLKGFVSVEPAPLGSRNQYLELSSIHVSFEMRGFGIGKNLFALAKDFAKQNGAEKLYISSHSSVESQAFYKAVGCIEAEEYDKNAVEKEPCDCQLECSL